MSPAVLFVNNATGQPGLLARFSVVVLDEVQTLKFEKRADRRRPQRLPGQCPAHQRRLARDVKRLRSGLAGKHRSRLASKPIRHPLVGELPAFLQETAFLDRLKGLIPGWEVQKLGSSSFASGVGLKSDFFGDALIALRHDLDADAYMQRRVGSGESAPMEGTSNLCAGSPVE